MSLEEVDLLLLAVYMVKKVMVLLVKSGYY